jgi:carboxypeptidase PM20D1
VTGDVAQKLSALLRIPTVSNVDDLGTDWEAFDRFLAALPGLFPAAHEVLERELIDGHSALYRWAGQPREGQSRENPVVLMAHYDVVPATAEGWHHPPFSGTLTGDGETAQIWGRGSLDDKGVLVAVLEAVERLAATGFSPRSDVYLSFGHNEETAGSGARLVARTLRDRGIRPRLVLDEGGAVVEGVFPGVRAPIAVVGVTEKGLLTLTLSVDQAGGHASTPPRFPATARLARAVTRLTRRSAPPRLSGPVREMIGTLGAHARWPHRAVFQNLWLTGPLVTAVFSRLSDETSALVRTTAAVTQLSGSAAPNVLAERATATVNVRIAADSSVADAVAHARKVIRDDEVRIEVQHPSEPSPVSPSSGPEWELLAGVIGAVFPAAVVTPYVMLQASDSRHFTAISDAVYRFLPFDLTKAERGTLHARNERIRVSTLNRAVEFFEELLRRI